MEFKFSASLVDLDYKVIKPFVTLLNECVFPRAQKLETNAGNVAITLLCIVLGRSVYVASF
jgi:hypothetical protein